MFPFFKEKRTDIPTIEVHATNPVVSQATQQSQRNSWGSEGPIMPRAAFTGNGNGSLRRSDSDGSLLIGRLV